ncbi:MAG TPA: YfhO family protein, partial [Chloroflexota bacterium]
RSSANRLRVEVNGASPGFLVLNELSYPGWKAYLDGRQVPVWRANYLFRAIEVPPGDHDIEFSFEPDSLKLGLALFLSTPAFLLVTAALRLRSRKKKESVPL